jgi:hypothetical protein
MRAGGRFFPKDENSCDDKKKDVASLRKIRYLMYKANKQRLSPLPIIIVPSEVNGMSKTQDAKKTKKTPPQKTPKEKKQAKREKKAK